MTGVCLLLKQFLHDFFLQKSVTRAKNEDLRHSFLINTRNYKNQLLNIAYTGSHLSRCNVANVAYKVKQN